MGKKKESQQRGQDLSGDVKRRIQIYYDNEILTSFPNKIWCIVHELRCLYFTNKRNGDTTSKYFARVYDMCRQEYIDKMITVDEYHQLKARCASKKKRHYMMVQFSIHPYEWKGEMYNYTLNRLVMDSFTKFDTYEEMKYTRFCIQGLYHNYYLPNMRKEA